MPVAAALDLPASLSLNDPLALRFEGWVHGGERHAAIAGVELLADGRRVAETALLFSRPDVAQALNLSADTPTGFACLAHAPELLGRETAVLSLRLRFHDGTTAAGPERSIKLIAHDYRHNDYGTLLRASENTPSHRSDIYASGPPARDAHPECCTLIQRYVSADAGRLLDVGCGSGAYGRVLHAAGYDWFGVEVNPTCCAELARLGLPHRQVDGTHLPFADGAFASAICIEVLEHIADPAPFLSEVRRVTAQRLLVSVPNVEVIPYLQDRRVVPWHLLEGDHKNFFVRPSLRTLLARHFRHVEVIAYAPLPLPTSEGLPLYNHLFAICDV